MPHPTTVPPSTSAEQPSTPLRDREQAEGYVAMVCFKHGPPRLHGVELERTLHDLEHPTRPVDIARLRVALGHHSPATLDPASPHAPLAHGSLVTVEPGGQVEISTPPHAALDTVVEHTRADSAQLAGLLRAHGLTLGSHGLDPHRPPRRVLATPRYAAMEQAYVAIGPGGTQMMCSSASLQVCLDAGEAQRHPVPLGRRARAGPAAGGAVRQLPAPRRRRHPLGLRPAEVRPAHLPAGHPAPGHDGRRPGAALGRPGHGGAGGLPAPRQRVVGRAGGAHLRGLDPGRRRGQPAGPHDRRPGLPPQHHVPARPTPRLPGDPLPRRPAGRLLGPPVRAASALCCRRLAPSTRRWRPPNQRGTGGSRPAGTACEDPRCAPPAAAVVDLGCAAVADLDLAPSTGSAVLDRLPQLVSTTDPEVLGMTTAPPLHDRSPEQLRAHVAEVLTRSRERSTVLTDAVDDDDLVAPALAADVAAGVGPRAHRQPGGAVAAARRRRPRAGAPGDRRAVRRVRAPPRRPARAAAAQPGRGPRLRRRGPRQGARRARPRAAARAGGCSSDGLRLRHGRPARAAARRDDAGHPPAPPRARRCCRARRRRRPPRAPAAAEVLVPGGPFTMGTSTEPWALDNERPAHQVRRRRRSSSTPPPVTNGAYAEFVDAGGYDDPRWWTAAGLGAPQRGRPRARRCSGSATAAAGGAAGSACIEPLPPRRAGAARLLVRGRRLRPLGRQAAAHRGGVGEGRPARPGDRAGPGATRGATTTRRPSTPTSASATCARRRPARYPAGASPLRRPPADRRRVGVDRPATSRPTPASRPFPYREYSEVFFGADYKVLRGGSFGTDPVACRGTFRNWDYPIRRQIFAGFRCARDARAGSSADACAGTWPTSARR